MKMAKNKKICIYILSVECKATGYSPNIGRYGRMCEFSLSLQIFIVNLERERERETKNKKKE
jgi:hypothetical protein